MSKRERQVDDERLPVGAEAFVWTEDMRLFVRP